MLVDKTIREFINELKSEAPTPGGGGVAALNSANGAALVMMVANLTVSIDKYEEWHDLCNKTLAEAQMLLDGLTAGVDADAAAFGTLIKAYGMPKSDEVEKTARSCAIAEASEKAAEAPLAVMEASVATLELDKGLLGKSNPNLVSDLYVAALCLKSGLIAAKYNVDANIGAIKRFKSDRADEIKERADFLLTKGCELADEILNK